MEEFRRIGVCLAAAGFAKSPKGFYHLLYEIEGELVEEEWIPTREPTKVHEESSVSRNVKANAPAAYIFVPGVDNGAVAQRWVFSVDRKDRLTFFVYGHDDGEWIDGDLGDGSETKVHPRSKLAAKVGKDGVYLFFVNGQGKIQYLLQHESSGWRVCEPLAAEPLPGTPFAVGGGKNELQVFYFGVDSVMHCHTKVYGRAAWEDRVLPMVAVEADIVEHLVSSLVTGCPGDEGFSVWLLVKDSLYQFAGGAEMARIGKMRRRKRLIADDEAQAGADGSTEREPLVENE